MFIKFNLMYNEVLNHLPYKSSFCFVDTISALDENGVTGEYTLRPDAFFYEDHFQGYPITPGVIITEIMAQIGVVVLGIYLIMQCGQDKAMPESSNIIPLLSSSQVEFFKMVLPGEKVKVISKKQYFRFNKLKCLAEMFNEKNEMVAKAVFSGMMMPGPIKNSA